MTVIIWQWLHDITFSMWHDFGYMTLSVWYDSGYMTFSMWHDIGYMTLSVWHDSCCMTWQWLHGMIDWLIITTSASSSSRTGTIQSGCYGFEKQKKKHDHGILLPEPLVVDKMPILLG